MRNFFRPSSAPEWLGDVLASIRAALSDIWPTPLRLSDYTTATLPPAADWKQGLAYDSTLNTPKFSDGMTWAGLQVAPVIQTKIAGYTETATAGEIVTLCDLAAGFTVVLPTAVGNAAILHFKKMQSAGSIILDGNGAQTIDGAATATMTMQYSVISLYSDNANWVII